MWDGPFEDGAFHRSEAFFGTGLRLEASSVTACASTALVDRLLYCATGNEVVVSNSLVLLLAFSGARLALAHDYGPDCNASLHGIFGQPWDLRVEHPTLADFRQLYHGNLVLAEGACSVALRSRRHAFASFEEYTARLRTTLAAIRANYESAARRYPVTAFSTTSAGYDSAAVASLAREVGVNECFTTSPQATGGATSTRRGQSMEDGASVARALGLVPHLLSPPSAATTVDEAYFLAANVWGSEIIFHDMARHIRATRRTAVVFTGYHGDKAWDVNTAGHYLADDIHRGDSSGLNLSEIRLHSGFVNVAVPFLFARGVADLVEIGRSAAMAPWRLGTDYDRPIPRRLVESAGVDRRLFGQRKRVVMTYANYPFCPALRRRYLEWLDRGFRFGRARLIAYEGLDRLESRLERAGFESSLGTSAGSLKDRLFGGRRLRSLMFAWAGNCLAEAAAETLRADAAPGGTGTR